MSFFVNFDRNDATPDFVISNIATALDMLPGDPTKKGYKAWLTNKLGGIATQSNDLVELAPDFVEPLARLLDDSYLRIAGISVPVAEAVIRIAEDINRPRPTESEQV